MHCMFIRPINKDNKGTIGREHANAIRINYKSLVTGFYFLFFIMSGPISTF